MMTYAAEKCAFCRPYYDLDNQVAEERACAVMADSCAEGIWTVSDGMSASPEDLPISIELKQRIADWQRLYDENERPSGWISLEFARDFSPMGRDIARALKRELPFWQIQYCDDERAIRRAMREENVLPSWTEITIRDAWRHVSLPGQVQSVRRSPPRF